MDLQFQFRSVKYTNCQYKYDIQAGKVQVVANNIVDDLELASLNKTSEFWILPYYFSF